MIGIQGDYAWTDAEGSHDSARETGVAYQQGQVAGDRTGRIGYAWDRFSATSRAKRRERRVRDHVVLGTAYTAPRRAGLTIGVGGEYAFTNALSGFVEYNYYDFGTREIASRVARLGPAVDTRRPRASCAPVSTPLRLRCAGRRQVLSAGS